MRDADLVSLVAGVTWARVVKTPSFPRQDTKSERTPATPECTLALGTSLSEALTPEDPDGRRRMVQARQDSELGVEEGKEAQDLQGIEARINLMA